MHRTYSTQRLILSTMSPTEAYKSLDFYKRNHEFFMPYEPVRTPVFFTIEHHERIIRLEESDINDLKILRLWLYKKSDTALSSPIGNFAFTNIVRGVFQSCFLGYKMDQAYARQGYMTEALVEGIRIIFNEYKLHRIEANIMPSNLPSLNLSRKLGFEDEGMAKSYLKINGQWEDHIHMVLLNDAV